MIVVGEVGLSIVLCRISGYDIVLRNSSNTVSLILCRDRVYHNESEVSLLTLDDYYNKNRLWKLVKDDVDNGIVEINNEILDSYIDLHYTRLINDWFKTKYINSIWGLSGAWGIINKQTTYEDCHKRNILIGEQLANKGKEIVKPVLKRMIRNSLFAVIHNI